MAHLGLLEGWIQFLRLRAKLPVRSKYQKQVRTFSIFLPFLKNRLPSGHIIPAVAVDNHNPAKALVNEILQQVPENIEISPRRGRQGSGKIQVMIRISQPENRSKQSAIFDKFRRSLHDLAQQHAVRKYRQ